VPREVGQRLSKAKTHFSRPERGSRWVSLV
jgi:hypothetical protein